MSIQLFLDGSGRLLFRNLTLLGAASKAHYDVFGPSASLLLRDTVVMCRGTVAAVPPAGAPQVSVLGVPANTTQVTLRGSGMHPATISCRCRRGTCRCRLDIGSLPPSLARCLLWPARLTALEVAPPLAMQVEDGDNLLQMLTEPGPASGPVTLLDMGNSNVSTSQADFGSIFSKPMADGR